MSKVAVKWNYGAKNLNDEAKEVLQIGKTDSAGGVGVSVSADISENTKEIKYVDYTLAAQNRVGDIIPSKTSGESTFTVQVIGPIKPNSKGIAHANYYNYDDMVFYNKTIASMALVSVKITFMDGTVEEIAGKDTETKKGCYVATCVYGSYNCPQVWTLRRYRDNTLAATWYGRAFIHIYYAISPSLVKRFGKTEWFTNMCKPKLDKMVKRLQSKGVEGTPYDDKMWR